MRRTMPFVLFLVLVVNTGCAQTGAKQREAGGPCEGCEAIHESPVAFSALSWTDTLPDFNEPGPKMLISGIVYAADGKTPAKDVVIYIYHTDQQGNYSLKGGEKGWAKRHGYIRGWAKTNEQGRYRFYTLRPASYPNSNAPQHIHPVIKEPGVSEYYVDEFLFDDDPNLNETERSRQEKRGGSGIIKLRKENGMLVGERNIILGQNIPGY